jgi:ribokinase
MTSPIYVIGSSNTDMVVKTDKLPGPGETVMGGTFFMNPGGKGANQAVAAARMGGRVTFVAHVGNDVFGQQAIQHFQRENISTSFITTDPDHPSGVALIVVDSKGENNITVASGSNSYLDQQKVELALSGLTAPGIVLLQMEIPEATVDFAITVSRAKKLKVILNPAPARPLDEDLFGYLYMITPNESEAEVLTGIKVIGPDTAAKAAKKLRDLGVPNVVITLGAKGAYLLTETVGKLIPAPPVKALDSTAAGDCFNGALAVALSENKSLEEAVLLACSAASISVTRLGAQASMPYRREIQDLKLKF